MNWQIKGKIYKGAFSRPVDVYFRPACGECKCRLYCDGQSELLFHFKAGHLFHYGLLFQQLSFMCEGRCPVAALWRVCKRSNSYLSCSSVVTYNLLRGAWNAFIRLLDMSWAKAFTCSVCGTQPEVIVCDGTDLGFRRDFLGYCQLGDEQAADKEKTGKRLPCTLVQGTKHDERVYIQKKKGRDLLQKYLRNVLAQSELAQFNSNVPTALAEFCASISVEGILPECYHPFFKQLGTNSPARGIFQIAPDSPAWREVTAILDRRSLTSSNLQLLDGSAPFLSLFLKLFVEHDAIPDKAICLINDILHVVASGIGKARQEQTTIISPATPLAIFPNLPPQRSLPQYAADRRSDLQSTCNKSATRHYTLTPAIFTLFCQHGVCVGFQALTSQESPRHPFEIFYQRFDSPPRIIIYDNCCRLHMYALSREPNHFRNTMFLIDRMHYRKGHSACTAGYCMESYKANKAIRMINSQVNEQANAGVQRLKAQLSYMTPDNFMFHLKLYFALKNNDVNDSLTSI